MDPAPLLLLLRSPSTQYPCALAHLGWSPANLVQIYSTHMEITTESRSSTWNRIHCLDGHAPICPQVDQGSFPHLWVAKVMSRCKGASVALYIYIGLIAESWSPFLGHIYEPARDSVVRFTPALCNFAVSSFSSFSFFPSFSFFFYLFLRSPRIGGDGHINIPYLYPLSDYTYYIYIYMNIYIYIL